MMIMIKLYYKIIIYYINSEMLFVLIDKIKKYVNNASDDAHLIAIIGAAIAWITYCKYKDRRDEMSQP